MIKRWLGVYLSICFVSTLTHATTANQPKIIAFLNSKDALANHIVLEKVNKKLVLINEGSSSSSSRFLYFLRTQKNQLYVDEIIGKTETSAILNNFAVHKMQVSLQESLDIGYQLQDQIQNNLNYSSAFDIQNALTAHNAVEISMGKIGPYTFLMHYQQIDDFANRTPHYVIRCKNQDYYLSPKHTIYMGYNQQDLKTPQYIVIQDHQNYRHVYADQLEKSLQKSGISCVAK